MECRLPMSDNDIHIDHRSNFVYFATHNIIIYRDMQFIKMASCDGELLARVPTPPNYDIFDHLEFDESVLLVFGGSNLIWMDNVGISPTSIELHPLKIGKCITKIFPSNHDNRIIFGTTKLGKVQFVNYDFVENRRIAQTSSWEVSDVTGIFVDNSIVYAILDYSTIVACDMSTGETLWTRFETARIQRGIFPIDGSLFYTSQGLLKSINGESQKIIRVPLVEISSIEHVDGKVIYFSSKDGKNLCQYDLRSEKMTWQIYGQYPIKESILVKNESGENLLLVRTENHVGVINLDKAKSESNIRTAEITRLRQTGDHVLIHKKDKTTVLIPGVGND